MIDIWQPAGGGARAAPLFHAPAEKSTPLYHLGAAVVTATGQAFAITYATGLRAAQLVLYSDRSTVSKRVPLPPTSGNPVRFLVDLEPGSKIWGFQVTLPDGGAGSFSLEAAGTSPLVHGFSLAGGMLTVDGSVEVRSASTQAVVARFPSATREEMDKGTWVVSVDFPGGARAGTVAFDGISGGHAAFAVDQDAAPRRLDFARGSTGFLPAEMRVTGALQGVRISQVPAGAPIPSDPGLILAARRSAWRRPDFELYSWSRFPRVLIFDTASYDVQDGMFSRLAFFVEKAGHVGRIEAPSAMSGVHGYNAHDYKADDLARFFSTAAKTGMALTPLEGTLLKTLIDNGIIVEEQNGYGPGGGCVLSLSRSSDSVLRRLLVTHESFHGVYFSLPAFREATAAVWASLSPVEQDVWREFLSSQKYNIEDNYLVVNEFQAYLLQQERSAVPGRQALILSRMRTSSTRGATLARELTAQVPTSFLKAFDALDSSLRALGGPPGGHVIGVSPASATTPSGDF